MKHQKRKITTSAFVTADTVEEWINPDKRDGALSLLRANGITKIYLDCWRGSHVPTAETLIEVRDFFRERGFEVKAGLTPTRGGFGKASTDGRWWLCYTNAETQRGIEKVVRTIAPIFDTIIVDDFLCTLCFCEECAQAKGERTWEAYYAELLVEVARNRIILPARDENENAHLTIKYPQWYDRFHVFGYDVQTHPRQFDEVWVGTEIRDTRVEYVHPYQAFVNYRWLASLSGDKIGGGWFDFINVYPEVYLEQAFQSVLAGARELIRFSYQPPLYSLENENTAALLEIMPSLMRLADFIGDRPLRGIMGYKPPNSDGEDEAYLFDYLGMLGLPLLPCHQFPADVPAIYLPVHAATDERIAEKTIAYLERGGTVLMSPGFLDALQRQGTSEARVLLTLAGYGMDATTPTDVWTYQFRVGGQHVSAEAHIRFLARLLPQDAEVLATAMTPYGELPVLTRHSGETGGTVFVFNAKTFRYPPNSSRVTVAQPVPLGHLPQPIVDLLRNQVLSSFGLQIRCRSQVGVYLYGADAVVLENFSDQTVTVEIDVPNERSGDVKDAISGRRLGSWEGNTLRLTIPRRSLVGLEY